jgi:hypothetical protein
MLTPLIKTKKNKIKTALGDFAAINCAVEESTVGPRAGGTLWPQDEFLRDSLGANDFLCVSVGGNDIALSSTLGTKLSMSMLIYLNSRETIEGGRAWGMGHFVKLFRDQVRAYLERLVAQTKPRAIVLAMIYFPDEAVTGSWADRVLGYLRYNTEPEKLQTAIRAIYKAATCEIREVGGVPVVPLPLFEHLDGKDTNDYVARVEPSAQGGAKMARAIIAAIDDFVANREGVQEQDADEGSSGSEGDDSGKCKRKRNPLKKCR